MPAEPHRKILSEKEIEQEQRRDDGEARPQAASDRDENEIDARHSDGDVRPVRKSLTVRQLVGIEDDVAEDHEPEREVHAVQDPPGPGAGPGD